MPVTFGIDLHWLAHAHGGPAVAALLKTLHPDIPIVFGGISAAYFHEELIRDPSIDFVLRACRAEPALLALVQQVKGRHIYASVPDLTWKDHDTIHVNPPVPPTIVDDSELDLGMLVRDVVTQLDFWTNVPFHTWWTHPITAVFTVRGCARGCVMCGASQAAFARFMNVRHPILRAPDSIGEQVRQLAEITRAPIFIVGDIRDGGPQYANAVIDAIGRTRARNRIIFEFFDPPATEFVRAIDAAIPCWGAELSPESHDESVRALLGKSRFTNAEMETSIDAILSSRCEHLDLFYLVGVPHQTYTSVMETVDSIEALFRRFDARLSAFITPMGPFLDPGSNGFEDAKAHGYRVRARTLADHRALLEQRDWESILNYETRWMTRGEIVDATYDAAERLNAAKKTYGRIDARTADAVANRLARARTLRAKLKGVEEPPAELIGQIRDFSEGTINDKAELFEPAAFLRNFRLGGIVRLLAHEAIRGIGASHRAPDPASCHV